MSRVRFAVVLTLLVAGCGGGGGGGEASGGAPGGGEAGGGAVVVNPSSCVANVLAGFAGNPDTTSAGTGGDGGGSGGGGGAGAGGGLGKVLGGAMLVTDLSDGHIVGEAVTDALQGLVTIKTCSLAGPFLLTLSGRAGAQYFDEGLNKRVDFPAGIVLHALVDQWDEHVGVSPLTEAAYRYALNNFILKPVDIAAGRAALASSGNMMGLSKAQVVAANAVVLQAVNALQTTNYSLPSVKSLPTPTDGGSSATSIPNSRYGLSAVVNGGLVKAANLFNPEARSPGLEFLEAFARDMTDGKIDGFSLDGKALVDAKDLPYDHNRLALGSSQGVEQIAARFSSNSLSAKLPAIVGGIAGLNYYKQDLFDQSDLSGSGPSADARAANVVHDAAILLSDGSVTLYRLENGISTSTLNFLTGVKQLFHQAAPSESFIDLSLNHAYALKEDGTVWVWGANTYCYDARLIDPFLYPDAYQRSRNTFADRSIFSNRTPIQVLGLPSISDLSIGKAGDTFLARSVDGSVYEWGRDVASKYFYRDALARLTTHEYVPVGGAAVNVTSNLTADSDGLLKICKPVAQRVSGIGRALSVASGTNAHAILTVDGLVYSWGYGVEVGQGLLSGATPTSQELVDSQIIPVPRVIAGLAGVRSLAAFPEPRGLFATFLALTRTNKQFIWGGADYPITNASPHELLVKGLDPSLITSYLDIFPTLSQPFQVLLHENGKVSLIRSKQSIEELSATPVDIPRIRALKTVGKSAWLFANDGRIFEVDPYTLLARDITQELRTGANEQFFVVSRRGTAAPKL